MYVCNGRLQNSIKYCECANARSENNANHCTSYYNQCLTICKQYVVNGVGHMYLIAFMTVCVPGICGITAVYVAELREDGLATYCIVPHIGRQGKHWQIW